MTPGEFLRHVPKIQLHCHLEGTLRAATFGELAAGHGVPLTYRSGGGDGSAYRFKDFGEFLMTFAAVSRSLAEPADYARLAREYAKDALAQNVAYAELFISPSVWQYFHPELDVRACMQAMRAEFDAVRDCLDARFIVDLTRNFGTESGRRSVQLALDLREFGVIGIGLGGDEARFPAEMFAEVFAFARAQDLHTVAHAGEAAGAPSVLAAIEIGAERIGHGIRALEDPAVLRTLRERKIALEVCPTSNWLTGVANRGEPHPLVRLDAAGCIVTIDADDPALFDTSLAAEYEYVESLVGPAALLRFIRNAVDFSFAEPARKAALHARLEPYEQHVGA